MAYERYFTDQWLAFYREVVRRYYFYDEALQDEVFDFVRDSLTRELQARDARQQTISDAEVKWRAQQRTKDYFRDKIKGRKKLPAFLTAFFGREDLAWKFFSWFCEQRLSILALQDNLRLVLQRRYPYDEIERLARQLEKTDVCQKAGQRLQGDGAELFEDGQHGYTPDGSDDYDRKLLLGVILGEVNADKLVNNQTRWAVDLKLTDDELIVLRLRYGGYKEHAWEEIEAFGIKSPRYKEEKALSKIRNVFTKYRIGFSDL